MTHDELIDGWESAWSSKDEDAFEAVCAPQIHYEDPLTAEPLEGLEDLGRHAGRLWAAFPDARLERTGERLAHGSFLAAPAKLLATHRAPLEGLPATVFLCDTFTGVVKAGAKDGEYTGGEHSDTSAEGVKALAAQLGLDNVRVLKGIFPDETARNLDSCRFRLCHIDVDVYDSARDVFDWCWTRLPVGGLVVFDDFGFHDCEGVTRLVTELATRRDVLFLHNLNGHALLIKRPPGNGQPSRKAIPS